MSWNAHMNHVRLSLVALSASLPCVAGCLIVRHNTKLDREAELQKQVVFQNEEAQRLFESRAANPLQRMADGKTNVVAIPFLMWSSTTRMKAEGAYYNDQIVICDTNGDRQITEAEAKKYNPNDGMQTQVTATYSGDGKTQKETVEVRQVRPSAVHQAGGQKP